MANEQTKPAVDYSDDDLICDDCGSSPQGYSGGTPYCGLCHKSHFSHPKKG